MDSVARFRRGSSDSFLSQDLTTSIRKADQLNI
jgi:hypothetical protein